MHASMYNYSYAPFDYIVSLVANALRTTAHSVNLRISCRCTEHEKTERSEQVMIQ